MSELTELQQIVKTVLDANPDITDDAEIAALCYYQQNPSGTYQGKNPSKQYVGKLRRRFARDQKDKQAEVNIALPDDFFKIPPEDEPDTEPDHDQDSDEEYYDPEDEFTPDDWFDPEPDPDTPQTYPKGTKFIVQDDELQSLVKAPFNLTARVTGYEGWRFDMNDPDEAKAVELLSRCLRKHSPDILDKYGLEVITAVTVVSVVGAKAYGYKQHREQQNQTAIQKAQPKQPAPPVPKQEPEQDDPDTTPEPKQVLPKGSEDFLRRQGL